MLYTRSSFIQYLREVHDCEIIPLDDSRERTLRIKNGPVSAYMFLTRKDRIDYEEIHIICNKLYLTDLPGDKDLERIE